MNRTMMHGSTNIKLTAGVSRLCRVEILIAFVKGFRFEQIASFRMVRRYSFEN